jgi:hypothetical protein
LRLPPMDGAAFLEPVAAGRDDGSKKQRTGACAPVLSRCSFRGGGPISALATTALPAVTLEVTLSLAG